MAKTLFSTPSPPVRLAKIAIGNPAIGNYGQLEATAVSLIHSRKVKMTDGLQLSIIETYPQLIGYDQDVYNYFKEQFVIFTLVSL